MAKAWGLALSGGGIFGLAHVGVAQVLYSAGLKPDYISGTSAGAVIGGLMAAGVDFGQIQEEICEMNWDNEFSDVRALGITAKSISGLIPGRALEMALVRLVGKVNLLELGIPIAITAVDLISGKQVVFTNRPPTAGPVGYYDPAKDRIYCSDVDLATAIRSSSSLPGVFTPKKYKEWILVDGGVKDIVPVYETRRMGAQEVIAVDLGTHADKTQGVGDLFSVLSRSFSLSARAQARKSLQEHSSLVIRPHVFEVGFPTRAKMQELVDAGKHVANEFLPEIIELLS